MIRNMPAFTLANASKNGTMDMLLNAGPLHNAIARLARESNYCVSGSSVNMSLTGCKFTLEDLQAQGRDAANLCIDYGEVPFRNDQGIGNTIIGLSNLHTLRVGCAYDQIVSLVRDRLNLDLTGVGSA